MSLSLSKIVPDYLKAHQGEQFKARDIALWIVENYPKECEKKARDSIFIESPEQLIYQIVAEIGSQRPQIQKKHPEVKTTEGKPRRYFWTEKSDVEEILTPPAENIIDSPIARTKSLNEHDLYPMVRKYLKIEHGVLSSRIDEKTSLNNMGANGNKWLFPDIVGMENLIEDWHIDVKQLLEKANVKTAKLWSLEIKLKINMSNVRESYFQAVSNSSWANVSYLVAAEIQNDTTMRELRMLYALHGVGVIRLDTDDILESQVIIPARERPDVDWTTCSRLATQNKDFQGYLKNVKTFYQTQDPHEALWKLPN